MKFTLTGLRALKPKAKRYDIFKDNGDGLAMRVFPSGTKSFMYVYKFSSRLRRMTLGRFPDVSLADANRLHAGALQTLKAGKDPGAIQQKIKQSDYEAESVGELANEFMSRYIIPGRKRPDFVQQTLDKNVLPYWKNRKAKDITRRDVVLLLDKIVDRDALVMANRTASILKQMFKFAVERDLLESSPCVYLRKPGGKEKPRSRNLSWGEIKTVWLKLDDTPMHRAINLVVKLLLVTGQRRGEVCHAEWSDIDLREKLWRQPGHKTKNGCANDVPLSGLALTLLDELKYLAGDSIYVVPSPLTTEKPVTDKAITRAVNRYQDAFGIENWTPHDLRRTVTSRMVEMGISPITIDKIQNHLEQGIRRHYDHYDYAKEKRHALDSWASKIESLISGNETNPVVQIHG